MESHKQKDLRKARWLGYLGYACLLIAAVLITVGGVSAVSSYSAMFNNPEVLSADPKGRMPEYAWCLIVAGPVLVISMVLRSMSRFRQLG